MNSRARCTCFSYDPSAAKRVTYQSSTSKIVCTTILKEANHIISKALVFFASFVFLTMLFENFYLFCVMDIQIMKFSKAVFEKL